MSEKKHRAKAYREAADIIKAYALGEDADTYNLIDAATADPIALGWRLAALASDAASKLAVRNGESPATVVDRLVDERLAGSVGARAAASSVHATYLRDLGDLIKREALALRERGNDATGNRSDDFDRGQLHGLSRVISLMLSHAAAFDLSPCELGLEGVDPERDLL